jgi:hypothetical protein
MDVPDRTKLSEITGFFVQPEDLTLHEVFYMVSTCSHEEFCFSRTPFSLRAKETVDAMWLIQRRIFELTLPLSFPNAWLESGDFRILPQELAPLFKSNYYICQKGCFCC